MAKKNRKRVGQFQIPALNNASRTLLDNIRFTSIDEKVKTIAVTSTGPDEGKTVVCANLACAIADSGKRVLLVDTDMRRRCIGTMLNIHPRYGLYSVLAGSAQLQSDHPHQETRAVLHGLRAQHPQPTRRAFNQTLRRAG